MDLRKSVLRYLHSVFDDDPTPLPGLIIQSALAFEWRVHGETLTVDGLSIDLRLRCLCDVADQLRQAGYAATVPQHLLNRSAVSLLDGAGAGTHANLSVQNSVLWALSLPGAMAQLEGQKSVSDAVTQLSFMTAGGGWLDLWGRYFDVPRLDGQVDAEYSAFIKREVLRKRSNPFAIQIAVKDWTGHDILVREPWKELFIWGKSRWDETDSRWQDGNFFTFGTIQPQAALTDADWADIVPVVQRNRALGCYLFPPGFAINGMLLTPNPNDIFVASVLADVYPAEIEADLALTASFALFTDVFYGYGIVGESSIWRGAWDSRTWIAGGRTYGVGFKITTITA